MGISELFTLIIYQPFLNILVFFYWLLGLFGNADMGVAVILLTLVIRFLLLPLSMAGERSEEERREIARRIKELERELSHDPVALRQQTKKVMRTNRRILISEIANLFIQVMISLMLWRIFSTGLTGKDLHLIYPVMPKVETPFNLVFLGKFDLSHPNFFLNVLQSVTIFALETIALLTSPYAVTRREVVRLQLTLPIVSFVIFMNLPAGKKLFVITTLCFSIVLTLFRFFKRSFSAYREKWELQEAAPETEPPLVKEVK